MSESENENEKKDRRTHHKKVLKYNPLCIYSIEDENNTRRVERQKLANGAKSESKQ